MAHSNNIISSIKLPNDNAVYEIHDAQAIHSVEELGLSSALVFKGTKTAVSNLPTSGNKVGDVWYVAADDCEYVWTDSSKWEAFGNVHDAASSTHTHTVAVTGTNKSSAVTGTVTVPTVSRTTKYLTATNSAPTVGTNFDSVLGANTTFTVSGGEASTTKIKASASGVAVAGSGTAAAITGFGAHTTDSVLGADATFKVSGGGTNTSNMVTTTIKNPTVTSVSIPNVTGNTAVTASKVSSAGSKTNGTAASWGASVNNGVLSFSWTANTPTAVTLPTFSDVTATNTTLGTALSASSVTTSDVAVATGALSTSGAGASVATGVKAFTVTVDNADPVEAITALGTATTANALTGVEVTSQPVVTLSSGSTGDVSVVTGVSGVSVTASGDNVSALTNIRVEASEITLKANATDTDMTGAIPYISTLTVGSTDASLKDGSAAAQVWTQSDGSTGAPQ